MRELHPALQSVESNRQSAARAKAAMGAIMALVETLAEERGERTARCDSAYQTIHGILLDLFDGAYWQGYTTGEDETSMLAARGEGRE